MGSTANETAGHRKEVELAANRLDALVKTAEAELKTADYWKPYDPEVAWRDGFANGFGGASSELVGILPPHALAEIVQVMRAEARATAGEISLHILALARVINEQAEAGGK